MAVLSIVGIFHCTCLAIVEALSLKVMKPTVLLQAGCSACKRLSARTCQSRNHNPAAGKALEASQCVRASTKRLPTMPPRTYTPHPQELQAEKNNATSIRVLVLDHGQQLWLLRTCKPTLLELEVRCIMLHNWCNVCVFWWSTSCKNNLQVWLIVFLNNTRQLSGMSACVP